MSRLKYNRFNFPTYVVLAFFHLFVPLNWSDDKVFAYYWENVGFSEFISKSARPFTDALTYLCCGHHIIWRLINPLIFVAFAILLAKIGGGKEQDQNCNVSCNLSCIGSC